jgi:hypothetical protein
MKRIICLIASVSFFGNLQAQYLMEKNPGNFNGIEISSAARVNLFQSDSNYVTLLSKNSLEKVPRMDVHGGVLEIASLFSGTINVYVKNISSIRVSDAARVTCKDTLKADNLIIHVSGAGRADILAQARIIKARANDAGFITLSGTADSLEVKASDAARVNGASLKVNGVRVVSSDGSSASVWAVKNIEANATDGSSVHIKGVPVQKNTSASDGGSVTMDNTGEETNQFNSTSKPMRDASDSGSPSKSKHNYGTVLVGMGFVTGSTNTGAPVRYGRSREFILGYERGKNLLKWDMIGFDIYYKSTDYFLHEDSSKTFPSKILHQAEKISFQNFGGLIFDRVIIGKKLFIDGGVYGDWAFHSKYITWDNNVPSTSSEKNTFRNLSFVNPLDYGLTFRLGSFKNGMMVYFNYRLSKLFQSTVTPAPAYPEIPAYVLGVCIGITK